MFLHSLYKTQPEDKEVFGCHYVCPDSVDFSDRKWHLVARYSTKEQGSCQSCEIYECRMPSRFYKLVVLPSNGNDGWSVQTGSGRDMAELLIAMAIQINKGMLSKTTTVETRQ